MGRGTISDLGHSNRSGVTWDVEQAEGWGRVEVGDFDVDLRSRDLHDFLNTVSLGADSSFRGGLEARDGHSD